MISYLLYISTKDGKLSYKLNALKERQPKITE